jgi:amino acid adenylation domain-containing protein
MIPRVSREGARYPLSFSQERLWFITQLQHGRSAYVDTRVQRVRAAVEPVLLWKGINEIIRRHDILRTVYLVEGGVPVQHVQPRFRLAPAVVDLRACDARHAERIASRLTSRMAQWPLPLSDAPPLRAALITLQDANHLLVLSLHHIAGDAASFEIFLQELWILYAAFAAGAASPLPAPALQYADFAVWQREAFEGGVLRKHLDYWTSQLPGAPSETALPTARPRPAVPRFRGAQERFLIPAALAAQLRALGRANKTTAFAVYVAAFGLLLHRYSLDDDITIGIPASSRTRPEVQPLIGLFSNTLLIRQRFTGDPTFAALLARARDTVRGALAHQDLPFDVLVQTLRPGRDLSRNPLFQVMLSFVNGRQAVAAAGSISSAPEAVETGVAYLDLSLVLADDGDCVYGALEYNTDLFDREMAAQMVRHFQRVLTCVAAEPARRIAEIPLLTDEERRRLLHGWNATALATPAGGVHDLIATTAAAVPDRIACVCGAAQLSYGELHRRAARVAAQLRQRGVGPDVLVGLCAGRSLELVVLLLGVLQAGGAYVPLDPAHPRERLARVLQDAAPRLVVGDAEGAAAARGVGVDVITLETAAPIAGAVATAPALDLALHPHHLAYVMYTSGSTGQPKGVEISHAGVVNLLAAGRARLGLSAADVLLAVTTISFDIAGLELYLPLWLGARVVIASRETTVDPQALAAALTRYGATALQATPTAWRLLLETGWRGPVRIFCGGEPLPPALARALVSAGPAAWNLYGPTETTIWSTAEPLAPGAPVPVSIGRPLGNTEVYVLDPRLQPVPPGVAGELYIGGAGLARGYRGRASLTAASFGPDPFSGRRGARLYRTGDRARTLADGRVEHLGRLDFQTKLRGYRIELPEIEAWLRGHPAVADAVVIVRDRGDDDPRLAAFIEPRSGLPEPTPADLRTWLQQQLPAYMVPTEIVSLPRLPLTPNGKVDRRAVASIEGLPDIAASVLSSADEEPATPSEAMVAGLLCELLHVDHLPMSADFFEQGGHSLMVTQFLARLRAKLGVQLPMRDFFDAPTVREIAARIDAAVFEAYQSRQTDLV